MATTQSSAVKTWGDADEDDNDVQELDLPQSYETTPDENGIKTVVEYKTKEDGTRVKITKKVRVSERDVRVNARVLERKKWAKFGDCAGLPLGPERGVTNVGDEVVLERTKDASKPNKAQQAVAPVGVYRRRVGAEFITGKDRSDEPPRASTAESQETGGPKKFVVPAKRSGGKMEGDSMRGKRDDVATVRVTNLSDDTNEGDLEDLFRRFGAISRIFLAKEKSSGRSKGFAFINFYRREDAQKAIDQLAGVGFDHTILHLEWAKPSKD